MATASIIHTQGTVSRAQEITCYGGETLTVTVTMKTSAGAARDCSGGSVALAFGRRGDSRSPLTASATGAANGVHTITIDRDTTHKLDKRYEYTVAYTDANGEVEACCDIGGLVIPDMVGGVGYDIGGGGSSVSAPIVQMTSPANSAVFGVGDVTWTFAASASTALDENNFWALVDGELIVERPTLTGNGAGISVTGTVTSSLAAGSHALSVRGTIGTASRDATARTVVVYQAPTVTCSVTTGVWALSGQVTIPFGATSTDTGEAFTDADFGILVDGEPVVTTAAILTGDGTAQVTGQFVVSLLTLGAHTVAITCLDQHEATTTSTAKTVNIHTAPVVTMDTPSNATPLPGVSTFNFTATDDAALTATNCVAVVDGVDTADTITLTGTAGSYSTTLSTAGAHTLAVKITDAHAAVTTSASVSVTVEQPTVSIATPAAGQTIDVSPAAMMGAVVPALANGAVVTVRDGVTVLGTTTLSSGNWSYTTAELSEGVHSLTASVTTLAGTVTSDARTIAVVDALPVIGSITPSGTTISAGPVPVTAAVTHSYGRDLLVRAKIDNGSYFDLTETGADAYGGASAPISSDGLHTTTVETTDALDWTDGALDTETASFTISYEVPWNSGIQTFATSFRSTTAIAGAVIVDLTAAAVSAVNGGILKVTVPATVTSFGLRLPTGYAQRSDASIQWVDATSLDGHVPWAAGAPWVGLFEIDTANETVSISSRSDVATVVGAAARLYRGADDSAIDLVARTNAGATSTETAAGAGVTAVADPLAATRRSTFGTVQASSGASPSYVIPVAGSSAAATLMGWFYNTSAVGTAPSGTDMIFTGGHAIGGAVFDNAPSFYKANGSDSGSAETTIPTGVEAQWGAITGRWNHFAFVRTATAHKMYINGQLFRTATADSVVTWDAGTGSGQGFVIWNSGFGYDNNAARMKNVAVGAYAATQEQILAHLNATSPVVTGAQQVLCCGSSLQVVTPSGGTSIAELARLAANASTDNWHVYAEAGATVDEFGGPVMPFQGQINRACSSWQARGNIVLLDWGNVKNQNGAAASMLREVKVSIGRGWRPLMIDFAGEYAGGGSTETGAVYRASQNAFYDLAGGSIIRIPTEQILGPTWLSKDWLSDDIHFNAAATALIGAYAGARIMELMAQPIPAAKPAWV